MNWLSNELKKKDIATITIIPWNDVTDNVVLVKNKIQKTPIIPNGTVNIIINGSSND
jgi:hypothetical protein